MVQVVCTQLLKEHKFSFVRELSKQQKRRSCFQINEIQTAREFLLDKRRTFQELGFSCFKLERLNYKLVLFFRLKHAGSRDFIRSFTLRPKKSLSVHEDVIYRQELKRKFGCFGLPHLSWRRSSQRLGTPAK